MVVGIIAKELFKTAIKYGTRYYRAEGKAFGKLYTGFPQSKTIGRGVRHGLTVGSLAGTLINDDGTPESTNGISKRFRTPSNKFYKTRRRFTNSSRRRNEYCPPTNYRRRRRV